MRNLFALRLAIWDMATYIGWRDNNESSNPQCVTDLLFNSEEEAEKYAENLYNDAEIYNEATLYSLSLTDEEILEVSEFDEFEDFEDAMREAYGNDPMGIDFHKSWYSDRKETLAEYIVDNGEEYLTPVDCANYDIDKSIEGSIVVVWQWHRYVGYARKFVELRYAYDRETEANLTKDDTVCGDKIDIVMTKEEIESCEDLESALTDKLIADWKWTNARDVERAIEII